MKERKESGGSLNAHNTVFLTGKQYDATKKAGILDQIAANAAWNAKSAMVVTQWFQEQTANLPSK